MIVMKNKTLLTVAACILALVFAAPAQAQRHLGICVEWNPHFGNFECVPENPLTGTTSMSEDTSFSIAFNSVDSVTNVVLIVLVPNQEVVDLEANFSQTGATSTGFIDPVQTDAPADFFELTSNDLLVASIDANVTLLDIASIAGGVDWHYNSIANVSLVPMDGLTDSYFVYVFDTTLGLDGIAVMPDGGTTIMVVMDGSFPTGTIFLAIGLDPSTSFDVTAGMPLTLSLQVPEPGSLTLLGSGLFALGFLRRKQLFG